MPNVKKEIVRVMLATEEKQVPAKRAVVSLKNLRDTVIAQESENFRYFSSTSCCSLFNEMKIRTIR